MDKRPAKKDKNKNKDHIKSDDNNDDIFNKGADHEEKEAESGKKFDAPNDGKVDKISDDGDVTEATDKQGDSTVKPKKKIPTDTNSSNTIDNTEDFDDDFVPSDSTFDLQNSVLANSVKLAQIKEFIKINQAKGPINSVLVYDARDNLNSYKGRLYVEIKGKVPSLFRFKSIKNPLLIDKVNQAKKLESFIPGVMLPHYQESRALVGDGTVSVKLELDPNIPGLSFLSEGEEGPVIFERVRSNGIKLNTFASEKESERRIQNFLRAMSVSRWYVNGVEKGSEGKGLNAIPEQNTLLFLQDNPHPYFGLYGHNIPWFTTAMLEVINRAPFVSSDDGPSESWGGLRVTGTATVVTDQFTSAITRLNKRSMDESRMPFEQYARLLAMNAVAGTDINLINTSASPMFRTMTSTVHQAKTTALRLLFDHELRANELSKYVKKADKCGHFIGTNMEDVLIGITEQTSSDISIATSLMRNCPPATSEEIHELIVLNETAHAYDINFVGVSGTNETDLAFSLLGALQTRTLFAGLAQCGSSSLLYHIMSILKSLDAAGYRILVANYGCVVQIVNGVYQRIDATMRPLTKDEVRAGFTYSIANPMVTNNNQIPQYMQAISAVLNTQYRSRVLQRKMAADRFYMSYDYQATDFFDIPLDKDHIANNVMADTTSENVNIIISLINRVQGPNAPARNMPTFNKGAFITALHLLQDVALSGAPLYMTMALWADLYKNSYLYNYDGYNHQEPNLPPREYALNATPNDNRVGVRSKPSINIRLGSVLSAVLSGNGLFPRPKVGRLSTVKRTISPRSFTYPDPRDLTQDMFEIDALSQRFNDAMSALTIFQTQDYDEEDVLAFLSSVRGQLQMSSFSELVNQASIAFGVNLRVFMQNYRANSYLADLRGANLYINLKERDGVTTNNPQNTHFGTPFFNQDENFTTIRDIMAFLTMSQASPFIRSSVGLMLMRITDSTIAAIPAVPQGRQHIRYVSNHAAPNATFAVYSDNKTAGYGFILPNGTVEPDPRSPNLNNILLVVDTFSEIAVVHIEFLITAIKNTTFGVIANNQRYSYRIVDHLDATEPIDVGDVDALLRTFLMSYVNSYLPVTFYDNRTALRVNNFHMTSGLPTIYVSPMAALRTNEVIKDIFQVNEPPAGHYIDTGDAFGFGDGETCPVSEVNKLVSEPNMNNELEYFTPNANFDDLPPVEITPPVLI